MWVQRFCKGQQYWNIATLLKPPESSDQQYSRFFTKLQHCSGAKLNQQISNVSVTFSCVQCASRTVPYAVRFLPPRAHQSYLDTSNIGFCAPLRACARTNMAAANCPARGRLGKLITNGFLLDFPPSWWGERRGVRPGLMVDWFDINLREAWRFSSPSCF